jgi:phosphatidylglycerophosphatase A
MTLTIPRGGRDKLAWQVATCAGLGTHVPAPGTCGTLIGMGLWLATCQSGWALELQLPLLVGLLGAGVWASGRAERACGMHDPGAIIIDEVAAGLLTFVGSTPNLSLAIVGLCCNRVLDIFKPWPIGRLQRLPRGWGIMADDVAAGGLSAVLLRLWPLAIKFIT